MEPLKLPDQEPEFKKWLEAVCYELLMSQPRKAREEFIKSMWSFYSMGSSPQDMGGFAKTWGMFNNQQED